MAAPIEKVELGFDQSFSANPNFFTLNDATKGQLDNTSYPLAGLQFVDVTARVRSYSISRGRNNIFNAFPAGQVRVEFNNHDRAFDPLYASSPYAGNIIPRREIRITAAGIVQFSGWIDDWNLSYTPDGNSVVDAVAYDAMSILSKQTLALGTPTSQLTGARVDSILDDIEWSSQLRDLDTGAATLGTQVIADNTNAINYLQNVANSEPGLLFVGKTGKVTFRDRRAVATSADLLDFGGTAIPFQNLEVIYGSEKLFNEVVLARTDGGTATAIDSQSIADYGLRNLTQNELLLNDDLDLAELALVLAQRFSQPQYRFGSLEVALHKLTPTQQEAVLSAEIGTVSRVTFTPNGIGDPIVRFVEVIRMEHTVAPTTHFVNFGFQAVDFAPLVLDDAEFGKLDTYSLSW